jgi:hypothetical protein
VEGGSQRPKQGSDGARIISPRDSLLQKSDRARIRAKINHGRENQIQRARVCARSDFLSSLIR